VKLDPAIWQGTWLSDEVVMVTTVMDADNGVLQAAWVERGPEGARFESETGVVRSTGDWLFLNMVHEPPDESGSAASADTADQPDKNSESNDEERQQPEYFWARVEHYGKRVVLWWPDTEAFRSAVSEGRIPGMIKEDKDVLVGPLEDSHMELINAPAGSLMNWSEPVVFIRIGD